MSDAKLENSENSLLMLFLEYGISIIVVNAERGELLARAAPGFKIDAEALATLRKYKAEILVELGVAPKGSARPVNRRKLAAPPILAEPVHIANVERPAAFAGKRTRRPGSHQCRDAVAAARRANGGRQLARRTIAGQRVQTVPLTDRRDGCVMFALIDRPGTLNPHAAPEYRFHGPSKSELAQWDCPPASQWIDASAKPAAAANVVSFEAARDRKRRAVRFANGPNGPRAA